MNNRPIKFRVWDKTKQKMSLVAQIHYADDGYSETTIIIPAPKTQEYYGLVSGENGVLMQFTGLKDKNSKEIYEGDIFYFDIEDCKKLCVVSFGEYTTPWDEWAETQNGFYLQQKNSSQYNQTFPLYYCKNNEIIGNFFENPELIKL